MTSQDDHLQISLGWQNLSTNRHNLTLRQGAVGASNSQSNQPNISEYLEPS